MSEAGGRKMTKGRSQDDEESEDEVWMSEDDDETIARIQRAHFAAMNSQRRAAPRSKPMTQKRKLEAVKTFQDFTKKLKKDTGISIRGLVGNNLLELSEFSSEEESKTDSDGLSEEEFVVNPSAVHELNEENESYIDPETGDFVEAKTKCKTEVPEEVEELPNSEPETLPVEVPKTLSISDIIDESDLDLSKNVEIAELEGSELCEEKTAEELLDLKTEESNSEFDINEKVSDDANEISEDTVKKEGQEGDTSPPDEEKKSEGDDEKKTTNPNTLNVRRNIREVMDEKNLDASTLTAQRQESERLARVQEQQRIIREVQRQIALSRQNKIHQKTLSLLQGGSSILKKSAPGQKVNLSSTVVMKLPSGETKKIVKPGQIEVTKLPKPSPSGSGASKPGKPEQRADKKEVVEIVDSSSGDDSSSSSSDSDDCIMLSDSELPPSPEVEEDPGNSGLHVNDTYNIPDEQGRVQINIGHPENEEDIFLAPQIARIIKPHQIGGVRFLFDNIIESTERFSTSTGFGCILAHSMGLGKTLQIVCFCDIFLRHTSSKTVLCIMPINTLQNWVAEFNMWLPLDPSSSPLAVHGEVRPRNFQIYVLNDSHKTLQMRAKVVKDWKTTGGVLMIGYELYRLLSMKKDKKPRKKKGAKLEAEKEKEKEEKKLDAGNEDTQGSDTMHSKAEDNRLGEDGEPVNKLEAEIKEELKKEESKGDSPLDEDKKLLDEMYEALVKPGPDLVICDEGHRIKNSHSNISYALKQMRTRRRIVLTGYPLQNNLLEYWCMVDFVRPNYLGSKTEFCNMFERPIQNGQCIDSTPQDIRLMRYRAHVLHSLLVGFVQRRSHAVLQSTLPQKEEYVLLVRLTPLQRKLYDRFMNEVVRSTSVPNPLKAFAICCKIWNHPDVLYNFLRKRSEVNAAIDEDLDLEELGGVTKAGRAKNNKGTTRRTGKTRGAGSKKPAATIQPNTSASVPPRPDNSYGNQQLPPNGPYGPPNAYRPDQSTGPYPYNYPNQGPGYYPPNQTYNQNYDSNYYQQPPYGNNYPNQYPQNNPEQGINQNYWENGNYFDSNTGYYNNQQYPNNQQQAFRGNQPPEFPSQQYPPQNFNAASSEQSYPDNQVQPYTGTQEGYGNQHRPAYQQGYPPNYSEFNSNASPGPSSLPYSNTQQPPNYQNQSYPPYAGNQQYGPNHPAPFNQYENQSQNYPGYNSNVPPNQLPGNNLPNQPIKTEPNATPNYQSNDVKPQFPAQSAGSFGNQGYNYNQPNTSSFSAPDSNVNGNFSNQYPNYASTLETKPPLGSASSGSPLTSWPITELKTEVDRLKAEERTEVKSESDGEVKIEDLDTKKIVKEESKKGLKNEIKKFEEPPMQVKDLVNKKVSANDAKSDASESEEEKGKKDKRKGRGKKAEKKTTPKSKAKGRKDRKTSKEKNNEHSDSEESEKEEKLNREEELALVKKAEEVTYDWAAELLKDYIPGIIENSAKMDLFFYILNESIKMGDRLLLFSQSLFTLNLIEDFLERNYIPGTNCLWERNTSYYRLDGSTHALEREKLINEFNANPNIYLFLVSTRAGSLGINLVGANRVIVFDASWNPCHDTQAVCRVYRYGQKKPCFVYRFVMDCCLEKKIYDRQINKQGMADRVVDECNPDAVLSMKEITNLCFDNDEKETEEKDLSEHREKYIDVLMQGILTLHGKLLTKEPFQHESLLVDRKEKKLSSAEKRLAQRGYELEKKAALAPKPAAAYRTVRAADGSLVQRPVASVRPMQHAARWIPADVWRRQGMTAQEMTLPLDVVIPTNSAEKTNIVLKAGQRVMVLKSPKGIYMQLESGKIIAIKTSLKGLAQKGGDNKDSPVGKKVLGRPNLPGSLKNNSAITITSKSGPRPGLQRVLSRPMMGQQKLTRPMLPGQKIQDIRNRLGDMRGFPALRAKMPMQQGRVMRPTLPGSVSITRITKDAKKPEIFKTKHKSNVGCDDEPQVLDSDDEDDSRNNSNDSSNDNQPKEVENKEVVEEHRAEEEARPVSSEEDAKATEPLVLTTDEKLPTEEVLENRPSEASTADVRQFPRETLVVEHAGASHKAERVEKKINLLKNYRHQRLGMRHPAESSLSQLEKTASALSKEGRPDFRRNLDDITQSYSPSNEEKPPTKSRKKKTPTKVEVEPPTDLPANTSMSHSVSSLLGSGGSTKARVPDPGSTVPIPHPGQSGLSNHRMPHESLNSGLGHMGQKPGLMAPPGGDGKLPSPAGAVPAAMPMNPIAPPPGYPANPPEGYPQYPGYGMGYGGYPNAPYYAGYGGGYYPPYGAAPAGYPPAASAAPPPEGYLPPNPQW